MQKFNGSLIRQFPSIITGNAAVGVQVTVFLTGTSTKAALYATNNTAGATLGNPLTTDSMGFYAFYAADGMYRLEFSDSRYQPLEISLLDSNQVVSEIGMGQGLVGQAASAALQSITSQQAEVEEAYDEAIVIINEAAENIPEALSLVGTGLTFNSDITTIPTGGLVAGNWATDLDTGEQFIWGFLGTTGYWWPMNPSYGTVSHQALPERNGPARHLSSDIDMGSGNSLSDLAGTGSTVSVAGVSAGVLANSYTQPRSVNKCARWANQLGKGIAPAIACFGDSTMFGATINNLGVQDPNNAPASLAQCLNLLYGVTVTPTNYGISGSTLRGMISGTDGSGSTFETKIAPGGVASGADIVYCNHGINDSQLDLSINQYRQDLYTFVDLCRKYGKTPVIVTANPNPPILIIDTAKTKRLREFVKVARQVAEQLDVDLVDQFYYFELTSRLIPIQDIVADGAHLTSRAYKQAGYNLAIPLVSAATIYKEGDFAGFTNSTFFDNADVNRSFNDNIAQAGPTLLFSQNGSNLRGLSLAFISEIPSDYLTLNHVSWANGTRMTLSLNGIDSTQYLNMYKNFGDATFTEWNAMSDLYITNKMWCGLNVLSLLIDNGYTNADVGFSGVTVLPRRFSSITRRDSRIYQLPIRQFNSVLFESVSITNAGNKLLLNDSTGSSVLQVVKVADIVKLQLLKNSAVTQTVDVSGVSIPDGNYPIELQVTPDSVLIKFSATGNSLSITSDLPNMYVATPWLSYTVEPMV